MSKYSTVTYAQRASAIWRVLNRFHADMRTYLQNDRTKTISCNFNHGFTKSEIDEVMTALEDECPYTNTEYYLPELFSETFRREPVIFNAWL